MKALLVLFLAPFQAFSFQFSVVWSPVYALLQPLQKRELKFNLESILQEATNLSGAGH